MSQAQPQGALVARGVTVGRHFTIPTQHPFDRHKWASRRAEVRDRKTGDVIFALDAVEVPEGWGQLAIDIASEKYLRKAGVPHTGHETGVRAMIGRVVHAIALSAEKQGNYAGSPLDLEALAAELAFILVNQRAAFNSPVWFNLGLKEAYGVTGEPIGNFTTDGELAKDRYSSPAVSACFIHKIEDCLRSISSAVSRETRIFSQGGGAGANYSYLRAKGEKLSGGGTSSGLMSFLDVFDANAGAIKSGGTTRRAARMVVVDVDHPDVLEFVDWKMREEAKVAALVAQGYDADFEGEAYRTVGGQNANNSIRVTDEFMHAVENGGTFSTRYRTTGKVAQTYDAGDMMDRISAAAWSCADPGLQYHDNINNWNTVPNFGPIRGCNPCAEFHFVDDTACNLASINLLRFLNKDGVFDVEGFRHACEVMILSQDILVDHASYPTREIAINSHRLRPLGLGFANLGALLMQRGLPYDSGAGRSWAAAITAIMCGAAWRQSARIAEAKGPFAEFEANRHAMLGVCARHGAAVEKIEAGAPDYLLSAAKQLWAEALALGTEHGFRNAQLTNIAPTGCLVPGSLVLTDAGLVRIEDLGEPSGPQWQDTDFQVQTDGGPRRATKFYVNGEADVIRVTTQRGFEITGTPKHQIKVVSPDGEWQWCRFDEIEQGSVVPCMVGGLFGLERPVALPGCPPSYRTNHHRGVQTPSQMSSDLAWLVGLYMAEGSLHHKGLRWSLTAADHDLIERASDTISTVFGVQPTVESHGECVALCLNSTQIRSWWQAAGFAKTPTKAGGKGAVCRVPDAVLATNSASVYGQFLNGLYSGDGSVASGLPSVTNKDRVFIGEIQTMMLVLGVPTRLDVQTGGFSKKPVYRLTSVGRQYGRTFLENVGFSASRKSGLVKTDSARVRDDYIPVSQALLDEVCPVSHGRRNEAMRHMRAARGISRSLAADLVTESHNSELTRRLGFYYDVVNDAALAGRSPTFDISVPENVTYVANGFVSHNTIGFLMECDTTGIEPCYMHVAYKKCAGGGMMKVVNESIEPALLRFGYSAEAARAILDYVLKHETVEGAPGLKAEDLPIFDCAVAAPNGERFIDPMGHVKMMAAVQPFLCGSISKTVNMPESVSWLDIKHVYMESWRLGLKCIAIYRDNSKGCQVLNAKKARQAPSASRPPSVRIRLPKRRNGFTQEATVGGHKVYIRTGEYEDGSLGELFIDMHKEGAPLRAWADSFAILTSIALQHGVPLSELVDAFTFTRFEPHGSVVGHDHVKQATSIVDYIFRSLGIEYLERLDLAHVHPLKDEQSDHESAADHSQNGNGVKRIASRDASVCPICNGLTQRSGTCSVCTSCGATTGCS